jgi:hypothetical protein
VARPQPRALAQAAFATASAVGAPGWGPGRGGARPAR